MFIKRVLIYFPLVLIIFLAQSFFWVPTYDKQAVGNPERLKKYIRGSSGDAEILNPVISADTASSSINSLVFDGLIALDDKLEYRPRLATSWTQTEEVFLVVDPRYRLEKIKNRLPSSADWVDYIKTSLEKNQQGIKNINHVRLNFHTSLNNFPSLLMLKKYLRLILKVVPTQQMLIQRDI